jgi:hypothetical protein
MYQEGKANGFKYLQGNPRRRELEMSRQIGGTTRLAEAQIPRTVQTLLLPDLTGTRFMP